MPGTKEDLPPIKSELFEAWLGVEWRGAFPWSDDVKTEKPATAAPSPTTNHNSLASTPASLPTQEMLKEEHEGAVLGVPQGLAPRATTTINIYSKTSMSDHIIRSLFNTVWASGHSPTL